MKKGLLYLLPAVMCCMSFSVLFSSCGPPLDRKVTTSNIEESYFTAVSIEAPVSCNITIDPTAQPSIQLVGGESLTKLIKTKVKDSILHIYNKDEFRIDWSDEVKANITIPSLRMLEMSGAGNTNVTGTIVGNSLKLDMSGVGRLTIAFIKVTELSADVSGAGSITIKAGTVDNANYDLSGTGTISAYGVQHGIAHASVSGAGSINLTATMQLIADISGVGNIRYKGHPAVTSDNSGVGKVTDAN